MAGTIVVDRIESDSSYASSINVASKVNFTGGMQVGGADITPGNFRNKIRNGDFRIQQRANTTILVGNFETTVRANAASYQIDGWKTPNLASKHNANLTLTITTANAAGLSAVTGNVLTLTVTNANTGNSYTGTSNDLGTIFSYHEGTYFADNLYGTADAKPMTLSFWVKSSMVGNYGIFMHNPRAYKRQIKQYTINQANTWEYKTILIEPDTTGAMYTNNLEGIRVEFRCSCSSDNCTSPSTSWTDTSANSYRSVTGNVDLFGTTGATWSIAAIQMEIGSVATPFETLPYHIALAWSQRYYQVQNGFLVGKYSSGSVPFMEWKPTVTMRVRPNESTGISITPYPNGSYSNTAYGTSDYVVTNNNTFIWNSGGDVLSTGGGWIFHGNGGNVASGSMAYAPQLCIQFNAEIG